MLGSGVHYERRSGGLGFAAHILWIVLIIAQLLLRLVPLLTR